MNFRDLNAKHNTKKCSYSTGITLRDMNFKAIVEIPEKPDEEIKSERKVTGNIPPKSTYIQSHNYQNVPVQSLYINNSVQSVPLQTIHTRPQQSVYIQPKTESQFLYYTQHNTPATPVKTSVSVPPRPTEPEKPDPSKFIEERTETPPPKMVRVTIPVRKKIDNKNNEFGAFGTTFDNDPDQSTIVSEIPVMNNVDDYKL